MKTEDALSSLASYLDKISETDLNEIVSEIDKLDIDGPSVKEYFALLTETIGSAFSEPSELATIEEVCHAFLDSRIQNTSMFDIPAGNISIPFAKEINGYQVPFEPGEISYLASAA